MLQLQDRNWIQCLEGVSSIWQTVKIKQKQKENDLFATK